MTSRHVWALVLLGLVYGGQICQADIFRYPGPELIPGTEGITPGPQVQLDHLSLYGADLSTVDLTSANFEASSLREATVVRANLTNANLKSADLGHAILWYTNLSGADLTGAHVVGAAFGGPLNVGNLTFGQLATTASYQMHDLREVWFNEMDLSGWDFRGQDLQNARLTTSQLAGVQFDQALVQGIQLDRVSGFLPQQLISTASYQNKDLRFLDMSAQDWNGIDLSGQDLSDAHFGEAVLRDADFQGANLTRASFFADLHDANFQDADLTGTTFFAATGYGLTEAQLASSHSYQVKNLTGIGLGGSDLRKWNFHDVNLSNANLTLAFLEGTDLTGANLSNARLPNATMSGVKVNSATVYNQWTEFPVGFDPVAAGLTRVDSPAGDLNGDGVLDTADLDAITRGTRIALPLPTAAVDFNQNGYLDSGDRDYWLAFLHPMILGDANADGKFDTNDLVHVFQFGQYEDHLSKDSGWEQGDWDGDGDFTSADFVKALTDGCFEMECIAPRFAHAVPEPSGLMILALTGVIVVANGRRVRCHSRATNGRFSNRGQRDRGH